MRSLQTLSIVGCHAEGEVGDVIIGGIVNVPGKTMYEKMVHMQTHKDHVRNLVLNEPRGRLAMNTNLVLPPCNPEADVGFLIMESEEWAPMSGSNTICTTTVLLETGMLEMKEPTTHLKLDTAAGLVGVQAECEGGKCKSVTFDNVPAFVDKLDLQVDVPDLGTVTVDIAWGGMWLAICDAASVGLEVRKEHAKKLVDIGERIKTAVQKLYTPTHPENPGIRGVSTISFTEPLIEEGDRKVALNTVIVSPGRHDRSPCGTGTSARMAVLHVRGLLSIGQTFVHRSLIGSEFQCSITDTTRVGERNAVLSRVKGRAWITSHKQIVLDPEDPYPEGFRVGD
ncbi:hypothetical protein N0V83_001593 [Neocucurbitaria cava]|uniref:Proline racemase n=1 Tax=Neocucurbitaria cava TaxID=798079 RepID=A0A9W8YG02_9PLEO|nr:hypothetical protein N0V83_001593 [Neocucurbitaria cava]